MFMTNSNREKGFSRLGRGFSSRQLWRSMIAMLGYRWRVGRRSPAGFQEMRIVPRQNHGTSGNATDE